LWFKKIIIRFKKSDANFTVIPPSRKDTEERNKAPPYWKIDQEFKKNLWY